MFFRLLFISFFLSSTSVPSYACEFGRNIHMVDMMFADVILEALVTDYLPDPERRTAMMTLRTLETIEGYHAETWSAIYRPATANVPASFDSNVPVLVTLTGHITETGAIIPSVVTKYCARTSLLQTTEEPGKSLKLSLKQLFAR